MSSYYTQARALAQNAFNQMLRFGKFNGETILSDENGHYNRKYTWRMYADAWKVHVTAPNGRTYVFTPAKSWVM